MSNTLYFAIDYDNCFDPLNITRLNETSYKIEGPIVDDIINKILRYQPDKVMIGSFSNRQDLSIENENSAKKKSLCSFLVFSSLVETLKIILPAYKNKLFLDDFLLADVIANLPHGATWQKSLTHIKNHEFPIAMKYGKVIGVEDALQHQVIGHERKVDLLYCKAHKVCTDNANSHVHIVIYDDRTDILNELYLTYRQFGQLLPSNFTAELCYFACNDNEKIASTYDILSDEEKIKKFDQMKNLTEEEQIQTMNRLAEKYTTNHTLAPRIFPFNIPYSNLATRIIVGNGNINCQGHLMNQQINSYFGKFKTEWINATIAENNRMLINVMHHLHRRTFVPSPLSYIRKQQWLNRLNRPINFGPKPQFFNHPPLFACYSILEPVLSKSIKSFKPGIDGNVIPTYNNQDFENMQSGMSIF